MGTRFIHLAVLLALALSLAPAGRAASISRTPQDPRPALFLIGDSTMADKPLVPAQPERGWGQLLPGYCKDSLLVENHAVNGRSSKSFIAEGRWNVITNRLRGGDWVIMQFGHNDQKREDPNRYVEAFTAYKTNLVRFIGEARALGARPIVATSVVRRSFDVDGRLKQTLGDYVEAARQVAREQNVPLLELNARSAEIVERLGPEPSKKLYLWFGPEDFTAFEKPKEDNTHFNAYGASRICDLAVDEIQKAVPDLAVHFRVSGD